MKVATLDYLISKQYFLPCAIITGQKIIVYMSVSFHFGSFVCLFFSLFVTLVVWFSLPRKTFKKCKQTYYVIFSYFYNFVSLNQKRKMEWKEQMFTSFADQICSVWLQHVTFLPEFLSDKRAAIVHCIQ